MSGSSAHHLIVVSLRWAPGDPAAERELGALEVGPRLGRGLRLARDRPDHRRVDRSCFSLGLSPHTVK